MDSMLLKLFRENFPMMIPFIWLKEENFHIFFKIIKKNLLKYLLYNQDIEH